MAWNHDGDRIDGEASASANAQLINFSRFGTRLAYSPAALNDRLTRGGPLAKTPARYSGNANFNTDTRTAISGRFGFELGRDDDGGWSRGANIGVVYRIAETLELNLGPRFEQSYETAQYVTTVTDPTASHTFGRRYLFADLRQTTLSVDTRFNVTLTPDISFELFVQPFLSSGDYGDPKELLRARSYDFARYGREVGTLESVEGGSRFRVDPDGSGPAPTFHVDNEDFNFRSFLGNAVFRWEWRPGSTLFLVWQQSMESESGTADGQGAGDFDFGHDAGELFRIRPDNIFQVKVSYWLNP